MTCDIHVLCLQHLVRTYIGVYMCVHESDGLYLYVCLLVCLYSIQLLYSVQRVAVQIPYPFVLGYMTYMCWIHSHPHACTCTCSLYACMYLYEPVLCRKSSFYILHAF